MGFSWPHPRDDESRVVRRGNDREGAVLRTCVDGPDRARGLRSLREPADPLPVGTRPQTSSAWPEAAAILLQRGTRDAEGGARPMAPCHIDVRGRCSFDRGYLRSAHADRGDVPRRKKSPLRMVPGRRPPFDASTYGGSPDPRRTGDCRRHSDWHGRRTTWRPPCLSSQHRKTARPFLPRPRRSDLAKRIARPLLPRRPTRLACPYPHEGQRLMTFRGDPSALTLSPLRGARGSDQIRSGEL